MGKPLKLLLVEDSENDAKLVLRMLKRGGFDLQSERVESAAAMAAALGRQPWDAVISDYNMPQFTGLDALNILRFTGMDIPFILISGTVGEEIAVDALKAGASDYVLKGNLSRLPKVLERELREAAIRAEHRQAQRRLIESEAGLHRAQIMARLAHAITRPDGSFESWSESMAELIGVEHGQIPKTTREWLDLVHPEDRAYCRATSIEAGRRGTRMSLEYRLRHPDGGWIHISHVLEPIESPGGLPDEMRWFNTLQDVTGPKRAAEALTLSEARYRAIFEQVAVGVVHSDLDGRVLNVNPKFLEISGYSREEALTKRIVDLTHPADIAKSIEARAALLAGKIPTYEREARTIRKDGSALWVHVTTSLIRTAAGGPQHFISIVHDISERKSQQERIERLSRVRAVLSGINALIVRVRDRDVLFREACRVAVEAGRFRLAWLGLVDRTAMRIKVVAWRGVRGVEEDYIKAMPLGLADAGAARCGLSGQAISEYKAMISDDMTQDPRVLLARESLELGLRSLVILPLLVGGEAVGVLALYAGEVGFFDDDEMKLLHELAGDIAFALDHIEKASQLDYLAYYDQLTGLANRTLFLERLSQYVHAAGVAEDKIALVLVDVERLRIVNDSLGRQAGDAVLKQLAERLARGAASGELARIGADVFAIVLPGIKGKSAVTRRIETTWHNCFSESIRVGDSEFRISAKAGVALFPNDGTDAETLLRNAEAALRRAKRTGERHVFHALEMTEKSAAKLTLETKLRQALENEEFVLHYQPKVNLQTGRITGMEALIRWQSPESGLVPPIQFISLMEETGMILEVGNWALSKAVADHLRWMELGLPATRVAVNVSPIQLRKRDFVSTVAEAAKRGSAPPGIDLEITESLVMEDIEGNIQKLKDVRGLGIGIAIDDFGTGYSSLGYLAKLPVQSLKIDRSFIITMLNDADTMTLVQTMISLAHSLRLKVVAEGVDSEEQAKYLRLLRCDEMQGYLFSRPVSFDQMTALLTQAPST